jgi:hypothetical protein
MVSALYLQAKTFEFFFPNIFRFRLLAITPLQVIVLPVFYALYGNVTLWQFSSFPLVRRYGPQNTIIFFLQHF